MRLSNERLTKADREHLLQPCQTESVERIFRSLVRGHEDRQAEIGQMVQRLVDADQGPEPGMLILLVTPSREDTSPLQRSTVM